MLLPGSDVPDLRGLIRGRGHEHRAVVAERQALDVAVVAVRRRTSAPVWASQSTASLTRLPPTEPPVAMRSPRGLHTALPVDSSVMVNRSRSSAIAACRASTASRRTTPSSTGRVDRLHREQDAPLRIDGQVRLRGRRQLAGEGQASLLDRGTALAHRDHGEPTRDQCGDRQDSDEGAQPTPRSTFELQLPDLPIRRHRALTVTLGRARRDVLSLESAEREASGSRPPLHLVESRANEEEARVVVGASPLRRAAGQAARSAEIVASFVDPAAQPRPLPQERFVRDLDGGLARRRFAIERQQAVPAERVEHRIEVLDVELEGGELGARHPAPGVLAPLAQVTRRRRT